MSDILNTLFDPYDRKARLGPALLCGLPFVVSIVLLVPDLGALWATVGGILLYGGGATFLVQIGRDRGKALEPELFRSWGGKPSVAILRLWCMDLRISISGSASVFESLSCLSSSTHRVATISPEPSTGS